MNLTGWILVLCIGVGVVFAGASVEAAGGKRGLPPKNELRREFNEKAKVRTPAKPPERPTSGRQGGPPPPKVFKNPGF